MPTLSNDAKQALYKAVQDGAVNAQVFGEITLDGRGLCCQAKNAAEEAFYCVRVIDDAIWISLETKDRWLSGSIEADLVNTGDKLDELIEEEVIDLGHHDAKVSFEHFRSPELMYVFRSRLSMAIDDSKASDHALIWLLGYEIVLRELGDMDDTQED